MIHRSCIRLMQTTATRIFKATSTHRDHSNQAQHCMQQNKNPDADEHLSAAGPCGCSSRPHGAPALSMLCAHLGAAAPSCRLHGGSDWPALHCRTQGRLPALGGPLRAAVNWCIRPSARYTALGYHQVLANRKCCRAGPLKTIQVSESRVRSKQPAYCAALLLRHVVSVKSL